MYILGFIEKMLSTLCSIALFIEFYVGVSSIKGGTGQSAALVVFMVQCNC